MLENLHQAIQQRPTEDKMNYLAQTLRKPPTIEEFTNNLKKCKENSAPGPTGLSYNMIKEWPEDLLKKVYEILAELWETQAIPEYWKNRLITLIPKKTLPNIEDFRPITLLETLRKLWTSITIRRITETVALGGYLHP